MPLKLSIAKRKRVGLHSAHMTTAALESAGHRSFTSRVCGFRLATLLNRRRHERVYHRLMANASRALDKAEQQRP
jgi:hypothetical protein